MARSCAGPSAGQHASVSTGPLLGAVEQLPPVDSPLAVDEPCIQTDQLKTLMGSGQGMHDIRSNVLSVWETERTEEREHALPRPLPSMLPASERLVTSGAAGVCT